MKDGGKVFKVGDEKEIGRIACKIHGGTLTPAIMEAVKVADELGMEIRYWENFLWDLEVRPKAGNRKLTRLVEDGYRSWPILSSRSPRRDGVRGMPWLAMSASAVGTRDYGDRDAVQEYDEDRNEYRPGVAEMRGRKFTKASLEAWLKELYAFRLKEARICIPRRREERERERERAAEEKAQKEKDARDKKEMTRRAKNLIKNLAACRPGAVAELKRVHEHYAKMELVIDDELSFNFTLHSNGGISGIEIAGDVKAITVLVALANVSRTSRTR